MHLQHLNAILFALHNHHLHLKRSKRLFTQPSVAYLGHVISANGITMDHEKVEVITS